MMLKKLPIRQFSWASAASRRLCSSSSLAAASETSLTMAEIEEEEEKTAGIEDKKQKEFFFRRLSTSVLAAASETSPTVAEIEEEEEKTAGIEDKKQKEFVPLYRRLSALGGAPAGAVFKTMNKWVREGRPTKAVELMKYVKDLRKYRRYKHALELMDWMVKVKGMNMSYPNHAIRIDLISKVKGTESAEDYFSKLPEAAKQERTYGALFNSYCAEKMLDKALALHQKMKDLGFAPNNLLHNNLMGLYMKLDQPEKVRVILQEMKASNLVPDNVTYCIVMRSYAAMDDIDSVERVIREMEEDEEVVVQWSAYSTLASIYISAGHFEKAELALKKLEGLIDSRDREPFHFLISLYASTGNLEEVNRVWKSLKATFVKCTNTSYLTMLQALNKLDNIEGLKQCYEEWELIYVTYDTKLTNAVLGGYLRKDMFEEAESLYTKTKEKEGELDFRTCELFMDYHLKKGEMGSALKWLEVAPQMVNDAQWKLNPEKVSLFLQRYVEAKDVDGIEKFYKILKKLDCLGPSVYESLIHTYAVVNRRDPSLRKRIKDENIELSPKTLELLDKVCAS